MQQPDVTDVVSRDCGYGFSAYAVLSDGKQAFHTQTLHPTSEQAEAEVTRRVAEASNDPRL